MLFDEISPLFHLRTLLPNRNGSPWQFIIVMFYKKLCGHQAPGGVNFSFCLQLRYLNHSQVFMTTTQRGLIVVFYGVGSSRRKSLDI